MTAHADDHHAHLLTPSFALSGVLPDDATSERSALTPEEIDAFLTEMEPDLRAADSDLRDINELVQKKQVTSAGKLGGTFDSSSRDGDDRFDMRDGYRL